jgi:transposase-like protein
MVRGNFKAKRASVTKKMKRQWSAREKLMIITYYEKGHSKRSTADKFGIEPKQLRDWLNNKEKLLSVAPHVQKLNLGARPKFPHLEDELMEWFTEARNQLKTVTRYMIQVKAQSLAKSYQSEYPQIRNGKFSRKWVDGFMSRHNLSNRRKTTIAQRLPEDYAEQQSEFLSYVLYLRRENDYPLSLIGNMDETPMSFNLPSNTTVEHSGSKTVSMLSTGHERSNFTVVLACLADGTKLPPVIIFKLKKIPREEFPEGVVIRANSQGWMNEEEMIWWIENIWTKRSQRGSNPKSLLILDSFTGHKTDTVKKRFREKKTDLAVIPGGLTSKLQPLDVSLNKPFKAKVRNLYNHWMSEAIKEYTPSGKIKRPSYSLVATWVKESWEAMDINMIKRSFKCCGISNNINGSEDTLIFNYNQLNKDNISRDVIHDDENSDDENSDDENSDDEKSDEELDYYQENEEQNVIHDWVQ